jgi:hypothetical protein
MTFPFGDLYRFTEAFRDEGEKVGQNVEIVRLQE